MEKISSSCEMYQQVFGNEAKKVKGLDTETSQIKSVKISLGGALIKYNKQETEFSIFAQLHYQWLEVSISNYLFIQYQP